MLFLAISGWNLKSNEKLKSLPVTSAHASQYGFPAEACFPTTAKYFVWRSLQSLHYVSINFHFLAIFMLISHFIEVKFKIKN